MAIVGPMFGRRLTLRGRAVTAPNGAVERKLYMIRTDWAELARLHRNDDVLNRVSRVLGPVIAEGTIAEMVHRWLSAPTLDHWRYAITFLTGEQVLDTAGATALYNQPSFPR